MANPKQALLISGFIFLTIPIVAVIPLLQTSESLSGSLNIAVATRSSPVPTPTSVPTPLPSDIELNVDKIEERLDDLQTLVEVQSGVYSATVTRMESNLNLLLAILAVASLLAAILGFGIVRVWIRSLMDDRLKDIASQEISRLVEEEVARLRDEWEPKFVELYEEYHRTTKGN